MQAQATTFDKQSFLLKVYSVTLSVVILHLLLHQLFHTAAYKSYMLVGFGIPLIIGLLLTKRKVTPEFSAHFYIISCYFLLVFNIASSGGVEAPGIVWFLLCPLTSFLVLSGRIAAYWLLIVLATLCLFYFLSDYLVIDKFGGGHYWYLATSVLFFPTVYSFIRAFRIETNKKSRELEVLNTLLQEKQTHLEREQRAIVELNESLERKVAERTAKLMTLNDQLTKFAYMNSHDIRGPVCRLLGLRNLLERTNDPEEIKELNQYLITSINELDEETRKASLVLKETRPLWTLEGVRSIQSDYESIS